MTNKVEASSISPLSHRERVRVRESKQANSRINYPLILAFSLREKEYPISGSALKTKLFIQDGTYNRREWSKGDED